MSGLVTVEEEGKENLGPEVVNNLGGRVEKDGVVEEIREEKEEWMGEVGGARIFLEVLCDIFIRFDTPHPLVCQGGIPYHPSSFHH